MPCLEISSSVTSFGREMIEHTKYGSLPTYTLKIHNILATSLAM